MNRLQKKCFFAAAGFHLLLVLILLIGPAFLSSSSKPENVPTIEFVAINTTDANIFGGGSPKGALPQPPAQPVITPPTPIPVAEKTPMPEPPPKEKVKEVTPPKDETPSLEPAKTSKPKIVVSTTPVIRKTDPQAAAKARAAAEAKETAERNKRIAAAFGHAVSSISENLSGSTTIELKGPGGGGVPYGNWLSALKKIYTDAWIVPDGVTDDSATATATVTIARDGEVISTSITRASGNALVDHSVKATLDRVRNVPKLPEGAKEDQRTVIINFNVKAKQGLG
jgi:TonB family protein